MYTLKVRKEDERIIVIFKLISGKDSPELYEMELYNPTPMAVNALVSDICVLDINEAPSPLLGVLLVEALL